MFTTIIENAVSDKQQKGTTTLVFGQHPLPGEQESGRLRRDGSNNIVKVFKS